MMLFIEATVEEFELPAVEPVFTETPALQHRYGWVVGPDLDSDDIDGPLEDIEGFYPKDDEWHQVKVTYKAPQPGLGNEAGLGQMFMQVDGEWVSESFIDGIAPDFGVERTIVLGNSIDFEYADEPAGYSGLLDDFKVWESDESPSRLSLLVDRGTGEVLLEGGEFSREIQYYEINSEGGNLNANTWTSLSDQGLDTVGDDPGESWDEKVASQSQLAEIFLLGSSTFSDQSNPSVSLGTVYSGDSELDEDLTAAILLAGDLEERFIPVTFFGDTLLDGDYNGNDVVDAPDYNVWRDSFGSEDDLRADGNRNGVVDTPDYNVWRDSFGNERGIGSHVPEPATAAWLAVLAPFWAFVRRRTKLEKARC